MGGFDSKGGETLADAVVKVGTFATDDQLLGNRRPPGWINTQPRPGPAVYKERFSNKLLI